MKFTKVSVVLFLAFLLVLGACSPMEETLNDGLPVNAETPVMDDEVSDSNAEDSVPEIKDVAELTLEAILNASLPSPLEDVVIIELVDGSYEGEPFVEGSSSRPVITLLAPVAFGDLDDDGIQEAAAVVVSNGGGSGTFYSLEIFRNVSGTPEHVASFELGDRIRMRGIGIQDGMIFVESVNHQETDSLSELPTQLSLASFNLVDGNIEIVKTQDLGSIAGEKFEVELSEIANTTWQWVAYLDNGETGSYGVASPENYTLTIFEDGTYRLLADCNYVNGGYDSESPSQIQFLPGASTLMACGEDSKDIEYLQKLGDVRTFVVANGQLHLNLMMDAGNMVFEPMMLLLDAPAALMTVD